MHHANHASTWAADLAESSQRFMAENIFCEYPKLVVIGGGRGEVGSAHGVAHVGGVLLHLCPVGPDFGAGDLTVVEPVVAVVVGEARRLQTHPGLPRPWSRKEE